MNAEKLAQLFHETYERLAPEHGYKTREASAKPWADVPEQNKGLMVAVAGEVLVALARPRPRRGTPDRPCEDCGQTDRGSFTERGFQRCNGCGYPGQ